MEITKHKAILKIEGRGSRKPKTITMNGNVITVIAELCRKETKSWVQVGEGKTISGNIKLDSA